MLENKKLVLKILSVAFLIGFAIFIGSCKKDKNTMIDYNYGVNLSSDYVNVQHLSISLANTYFKAIYDTALISNGTSEIDGATVTYCPDSVYKLKITYPSWGSNDGYGNWRQGQIQIQADGGFFDENENAKFKFVNFYFTKDTITASEYSVKYLGSSQGNDQFQIVGDEVYRTMEDTTGNISFNSSQFFTVVLNANNKFVPENLLISGSIKGISRLGYMFEATTQYEIISDLSCNWMKSGEVEVLSDSSEFQGKITYSDISECNNWYSLLIDGIEFPSAIEKEKFQ